MEGLCGNCNADVEDDLQGNPTKKTKIMDINVELTPKQKIDNFVLSWLAEEPKLKLKEQFCYVDRTEPCLLLPQETDPCFEILRNPVFELVSFNLTK